MTPLEKASTCMSLEKTATSHGDGVVASIGWTAVMSGSQAYDKAAVTDNGSAAADLEASATHLNHERVRLRGTIRSDRVRRGDSGTDSSSKSEIDLHQPWGLLERIEKDGLRSVPKDSVTARTTTAWEHC